MNEIARLFDSVFSGILSSFTSALDQAFADFETHIPSENINNEALDEILQQFLLKFPREHPNYRSMISSLAGFVTTNPAIILANLCSKYKNEINRAQDGASPLLSLSSLTFKAPHFQQYQFVRYVNLFILSDLIFSIFEQSPQRQAIAKLVPCGYVTCTCENRLLKVQTLLIETWSFIFRKMSTISWTEIVVAIDQYYDDICAGRVFFLLSRINAEQKFIDSLLFTTTQAKKRKTINSEMLSSLAILLSHHECDSEQLNEFFNLAWSIKTTANLKDGAIDLITALFPRLPAHNKKVMPFYQSRVFKHVAEDAKLERTLHAFQRLIRGDVSSIKGDVEEPFFGISCAGQPQGDSFQVQFMHTFFAKSNFSVCPYLFRDVMFHLAAVDLKGFVSTVLTPSLKLSPKDRRFLVCLMLVPLVNSPTFKNKAVCKPTDGQIVEFNNAVKQKLLPLIPKILEGETKVNHSLSIDFIPIDKSVVEADHILFDFMTQNNYTGFDQTFSDPNPKSVCGDEFSLVRHIIQALPFITDLSQLDTIPHFLIQMTVNSDRLISTIATETIHKIFTTEASQNILLNQCIDVLETTQSLELYAQALLLIFQIIKHPIGYFPTELFDKIKSFAFVSLITTSPLIRNIAYSLIKYIGAIKESRVFSIIYENADIIAETVKRALLVINVPARPSLISPPVGPLSLELACNSHYNGLWILFFAEMMDILLDNNEETSVFLNDAKDLLTPMIKKQKIPKPFMQEVVYLLYINILAQSVDDESDEESPAVQEVETMFEELLEEGTHSTKIVLLKTFYYMNWRMIPSVFPVLLSVDQSYYPKVANALSFILQNPDNFSHIISSIFRRFLEFLSMLQSYFIKNEINSARHIQWDEKHLTCLHQNIGICLDYCIMISAVFNNLQDQIPDEEWPVSYRQVLVQFLIHWVQLPPGNEKLSAYALNALIPIIQAGTLFTEGFVFELPMLEMMVQCQTQGYPVLESLLFYHLDILLDVFVKNVFMRPRRESQLFIEAIGGAIENCDDSSFLQSHVGCLLLLTMFCEQTNLDLSKQILKKLVTFYIDKSSTAESTEAIEGAANLSFVPSVFNFATEQVIDSALDIIKASTKVTIIKTIVQFLIPWFSKIRLLPTHAYIVQGVPTKFRKYTVITFFDAMFAISQNLDDEKHDALAQLWVELLQSADNSVVVLLCLFESQDSVNKERIFTQLLERQPALISKYLAKRCSFAYWYFMKTHRQRDISSLSWVLGVLTRAFIDYVDESAPNYTTALHFSMLFIEEAQPLYEALFAVFGIDTADPSFVWTMNSSAQKLQASVIVSSLAKELHEQSPEAIDKWALEAARWAVCCNDIKTATRSLVILNALEGAIPPAFVPLLTDSTLYFLEKTTEEDRQMLSSYVAECFEVLFQHIESADVSSYAFSFANAFLRCDELEDSCLVRAMPIFKYCLEQPVLSASARAILVDAVAPYAPLLETDVRAQILLAEMLELNKAPEIMFMAAVFLRTPLPFVDVPLTYRQVLSTPLSAANVSRVIQIYSTMLKRASPQLIDAVLTVSTDLLQKYDKSIDRKSLAPIFQIALKHIADLESAVSFVQALSRADPSIATMKLESEFFGKPIEEVIQTIQELQEPSTETAPITNCKMMEQLRGMITQESPPKIYPFATQYDMYLGLKKEVDKVHQPKTLVNGKRWSSTMSMTSVMLSNRSLLIPEIQKASDPNAITKFSPLEHKIVQQKLLDLPGEDNEPWQFIVSPKEFIKFEC